MQRIAMGIEYVGHHFHGFQAQASGVSTIQQALEQALSLICNEPITLVCAGRTDMGVHATQQIIHFDTLAERPERAWLRGANTHLPDGISIRWVKPISPYFHARFSARSRTYRYIIYNTSTPSALLTHFVTWDRRRLDIDAMRTGSRYLLGEHDFSAFRGAGCQARNPVRHLERIDIKSGDFIISRSNSIYHMGRNIVGVLLAVGSGEKEVLGFLMALNKDRRCASVTAPAAGLYLVSVTYDNTFGLPSLVKVMTY